MFGGELIAVAVAGQDDRCQNLTGHPDPGHLQFQALHVHSCAVTCLPFGDERGEGPRRMRETLMPLASTTPTLTLVSNAAS